MDVFRVSIVVQLDSLFVEKDVRSHDMNIRTSSKWVGLMKLEIFHARGFHDLYVPVRGSETDLRLEPVAS